MRGPLIVGNSRMSFALHSKAVSGVCPIPHFPEFHIWPAFRGPFVTSMKPQIRHLHSERQFAAQNVKPFAKPSAS